MSNDSKGVQDAPQTPPVPPSTPPDPPIPPIQLNTIWDAAKIVTFVLVWYITSDANHALTANVDYAKLSAAGSTLCGISWAGAKIGILQGLIMSVQALAVIWASPSLFTALGPVLQAAFRTPIKIVAEFRRALQPKSKDGDGDDDGEGKKKS
jgi:hypothetical protein